MPPFGPISRGDLVPRLRRAGFEGPYTGKKHQIMRRGNLTVRVPNPHGSDIGKGLLATILREASVSREEWEKL